MNKTINKESLVKKEENTENIRNISKISIENNFELDLLE